MVRKPNYRFDRMEKDRAKAAKKEERLKAKQERSSAKGRQPAGLEESETAPPSEAAPAPEPEPEPEEK